MVHRPDVSLLNSKRFNCKKDLTVKNIPFVRKRIVKYKGNISTLYGRITMHGTGYGFSFKALKELELAIQLILKMCKTI